MTTDELWALVEAAKLRGVTVVVDTQSQHVGGEHRSWAEVIASDRRPNPQVAHCADDCDANLIAGLINSASDLLGYRDAYDACVEYQASLMDRIDALEKLLQKAGEALEPFSEAALDIDAECVFGRLGTREAGVWYPDNLKLAAIHVRDETAQFNGGEDDVGQYTLGDLRKLATLAAEIKTHRAGQ